MSQNVTHLQDATRVMKAAGAVEADAGHTVIDLMSGAPAGSPVGRRAGMVVINVSAIDIGNDNEINDIIVQGSNDAAFGVDTDIEDLAQISIGSAGGKRSDSNKADVAGEYRLYFDNERPGGAKRYVRLYTDLSGTNAGITYGAYLVPQPAAQ